MKNVLFTLSVLGLSMAAFGFGGFPGPGGGGRGPAGFGRGGMGGMPGGFGPGGMGMMGFPGMGGATDDSAAVQKQVGATNEEWRVIWAKLEKVRQLRAEVDASLVNGSASGGDMMGMMLGGPGMPGGGNSLEGSSSQPGGSNMPGGMPGMPGGMPGMGNMPGMPGFGNAAQGPFASPPSANGAGPMGMMGAMPGMPGGMGAMPAMPGGMGGFMSTTQGNAVQSLLSEMQTLLSDKSATEDTIREKLETIRATRARAKTDLKTAEADVMELLTAKQVATLVSLGYLE